MNDFIAKLTEMMALGILRAMSRPGSMTGLCNAWRAAMEPQQIIAGKPDKDDDAFINNAKEDGWSSSTHAGPLH